MGSPATNTIRSDGERSMRGYACLDVPPPAPEPPAMLARVVITEPRSGSRSGWPQGAAPRNPEQTRFPAPRPPGVELLDGLPMAKAQRIWLDPEQLAAWDEEERAKR